MLENGEIKKKRLYRLAQKFKSQKTFIGSLVIHNIFTNFLQTKEEKTKQTKEENISSFTITTGNNHNLIFSSVLSTIDLSSIHC